MGGASFPIYGRLVFRRGNRNRDSTWKTGLYLKKQKQKTSAHHQLHPCKLHLYLQGWAECLDVKTILDILETPCFQDVQADPSPIWGKKDEILNNFFSASSVVSSHGPSAAAKEHEKRILESILPPDLRCRRSLLYFSQLMRPITRSENYCEILIYKSNFQASYQRRFRRQHFSVDSG